MPKKILFLAAFAILLAGCLPGAQPTQDIQAQINTAIAQTMEINKLVDANVQQTLTALAPAASPTLAPTSTPEPTFESIALITDTPLPLPQPINVVPNAPQVPAPTQKLFSCYVTTIKPKTSEVHKGQGFDIVWLIVNTGTRPILAGTDFKFSGGINMANGSRIELKNNVAQGESYKVELDGTAPLEKGSKYMAWKLESPVCYGEVYITVK